MEHKRTEGYVIVSSTAHDRDKTTLIDDSKVEKILARKPGVISNIQELICSSLKDDSFINKLVHKPSVSQCTMSVMS